MVTPTSASVVTVALTEAALSAWLTSYVVLVTDDVSVACAPGVAAASTSPLTAISKVAPDAIVVRSHRAFCPDTVHVAPGMLAVTLTMPAGTTAVTVTPVAVLGPASTTVRLVVAVRPATTPAAVIAAVTRRSAAGFTVLLTVLPVEVRVLFATGSSYVAAPSVLTVVSAAAVFTRT